MLPTALLLGLVSNAALALPQERAAAPLDRALATVSERGLQADLEFLAAPELGGRGTPSDGLEWAAQFVEARMRRLGLEPGSTEGFQPRFELRGRRLDPSGSSVAVRAAETEAALVYGRDVFLRGTADLGAVDFAAGVTGVGDGRRGTVEALGDLGGAWALLVDRGRGTAGAIRRSFDAGAGGVLVVAGPEYEREPYAERYGAVTSQLSEARFVPPAAAPPASASTAPVLFLAPSGLELLLGLAGRGSTPEAGQALELTVHDRRAVEEQSVTAPNVAALLPGADPDRRGEVIVLCAHLDHLGTRADGTLYPGADDNASGSVGLMAMAEALVARGPLARSVLFLWVSGEENGLWGSAAWCRDPRLPEGFAPRAALNLDMIGRDAPATLWVTPTADHPAFNPLAALGPELAASEGFTDIVSQDSYWRASDHYSFASELRIPVLYLSSGEHDDYHQPSDVAERIDYEKLARMVRLFLRVLERSDALTLESVERIGSTRR